MKKITLFLFALFSCWQMNAQVSAYGFSQSTGTYSEITGGTVLGVSDNDDTNFNGITIGFDFVYNGVTYTQVSVQSNGFLALGATVSSSYTAISSGGTNNVIAALNRDLQGNAGTGELSYQLSGTAPNRILTVQWKNYRSFFAEGDVYNFQIKLYETTNLIDVVYGSFTQNADNRVVQVGLRGPDNTAFNNRSTTTDWSATTAGVANNATCTLTTAIKPSSGLTFTWTPPAPCTGTPVAGTVTPESQNACVGFIPADLVLSGFTQGASGITFQWETSTNNVDWTNAAGASAITALYDTPAFDGLATVYYRCKVTCTASTLFSYSNVVTVNPPANPSNQATNLNFTNISYTGFTANWTNANGNRRVVYISNTPIVDPTNGSGPALVPATIYGGTGQQVVFDGTGTSVTVTGLNLATQYYVKVIEYARCGSAAPFEYFFNTTTDTNANTVTTSSATALPWEEGFTATTVPSNWIAADWILGALNAALNEGTTSNYLYRNIYSAFTSGGSFTTPIFASVPANYRFTFTNKFRNWSSAVDTTPENSNAFIVSISTDNGATFSEVETVINSGSGNWDVYTLNLAPFIGQNIRIRITSNWIAGDYWAAFDNFKIEPIPACTEPNSLNVSLITNDTALLGWTEAATSTAWQVQWGTTGFALGSGTIVPVTENSLALSNLNGNTSYSFYVRAVCSVGNESPWVGPISFKTDCDAVTDYFENFQGIPAVFNGPLVDCFTKGGNGQVYLTTFGGGTPMAGNRLQMSANPQATPVPQESFVSLKPVSNLSAGTHRLRFLAANSFGEATFLELGYFLNNEFTPIHQFENITTATQQFVFTPSSVPTGIERLVLKFTNLSSPDAAFGTIYIDNVYWEPNPTSVPACATNIVATPNATCGNFATSITWDNVSGADGYKLRLGTTPGGTEIFANENIGILNSYSFVGNFNTTYYYTIIPYNGFGDATGCTELSFATAVNGCYCTSLPTSNDASGITNVLLGTTNFPTTDVTYFDHTAITVSLQQGLNTNVQITFATGYTYNTYIWIDFNDNLTFESNELVFTGESPSTNPIVYNASFLMPATAALGQHRMRIVTADFLTAPDPCYSGSYGVTLDFNVNIVVASCTPPAFSTVTTTPNCDNDTFFINVNVTNLGSGTPSISDGTTSFPVTATGIVQVGPFSAQSVTLTLLHGTEAACNVAIGTYINSCLPVFCFNAEYGQWPSGAFTPACLNAVESITSSGFASEYSVVNVLAGNDYTFTSSVLTDYITIGNSTGTLGLASGGGGSVTWTSNITGAVRFYTHTNDLCGASTDSRTRSVQCQVSLSTPSFDETSFKVYPNPVTDILTVAYSNVISEVIVYNLLGQQVATVKPNADQTQVDLSGLTAGTYMVKITSDEVTKTVKVVKN